MVKVSLCLLTFNELPGCERDVPNIPIDEFHEVFCVDGHSTDGTVDFLKKRGIPIHPQPKKGLTAGYVHAAKIATGDAMIVFFPKGTIPIESILEMKTKLEEGHELVIASRNLDGAVNEDDASFLKPRKWFVQVLGTIISILWRREGIKITDVLHGVKGISLRAFEAMGIEPEGQEIDLLIGIRAYKMKLKRCEVPVHETPRFYGGTHFSAIPAGSRLLIFLTREIFGLNRGSKLGLEQIKT